LGKRATSRKLAMQALYQADTTGEDIEDVFKELFLREDYLKETEKFSEALSCGAWKERAASDKVITKLSKDWTLNRIGRVVLSVLRLAIYELKFEKDTPASVVINEAVELAKRFSSPEAGKFVNGILGAFVKEREQCSQGS